MGVSLALRPVRLPDQKKHWPFGGNAVTDFVEGQAIALDEDDGNIILTDDTHRDIASF